MGLCQQDVNRIPETRMNRRHLRPSGEPTQGYPTVGFPSWLRRKLSVGVGRCGLVGQHPGRRQKGLPGRA